MAVSLTLTASSSDAQRIATGLGFTGSSSQGNVGAFLKNVIVNYVVGQVTAYEANNNAQVAYANAYAAAASSSAQVVVT